MNRKAMLSLVLFIALVVSFVSIYPASAWTYPDCTEDDRYELFGPRADRILIKLYASEDAEWDALEAGELDMTDWPATQTRIEKWSEAPYNETIKQLDYGAEYGFYVIDINNNPNPYLGNPPDPEYPNPKYPNPCSVAGFRHALAHCLDRQYVVTHIWGGRGVAMYTDLAPVQAGVHPEIRPGGLLENLTHPYNLTEAARILDESGFPIGPDGWRYWDRNGNGQKDEGEDVVLDFYIRSDHALRNQLGDWFADQLESEPVKIKVNRIYKDSYGCWLQVMLAKDFHLYTGGWSVGVDPDTGDLYYIEYYWHPGFCYNYDCVNCSEFNYWHEKVLTANTFPELIEAVYKEQEAFCSPDCIGALPVVSNGPCIRGVARRYVGAEPGEEDYTGQYWKGIVNVQGYGPDSYWSFLNMHPECSPMGDGEHMTIRYGFKVRELKKLNPVYAEWVWDWNTLGLIYEGPIYRNPYFLLEWKPLWLKNFTVFTWTDPEDGTVKSGVRMTLRSDITWHDGTPVTVADIYYSWIELPRKLIDNGFPPPWWYPTIVHFKSFYIIDPCNIEILLDKKSVLALSYVSTTVLPKHIWDPIVERNIAGTNPEWEAIEGFAPDPNLIGSGAWRLEEYVPGSYITLVANRPGVTVQTNLEGSEPITSPYGYYRNGPIDVDVHIIAPAELEFRQKVPPCTTVTFQVSIKNMWLNPIPNTAGAPLYSDLTIEKYVWIVYPNGTEKILVDGEVVTIPGGEEYIETFDEHFDPCKHEFKVAVRIIGPETIECTKEDGVVTKPNPWLGTWKNYTFTFWVTIKQDVAGSFFVNPQLPAPDCICDITDIYGAALA
ncbi:hypothetical protein DRO69_10155, partial [Candidatus Bathyarchaeota archaeon]